MCVDIFNNQIFLSFTTTHATIARASRSVLLYLTAVREPSRGSLCVRSARSPFYLLGNVKNRIAHPAMTGWPPCSLTFQAQIIQDGLSAASVGTVLRPESADTPASWPPAKRRPLLTSGSLSYFVAHVPQLDKWELKRRNREEK